MKTLPDQKINVTEKLEFVLGTVEKIMGKGQNAGYTSIFSFFQCFQKASSSGSLKVRIVCGKRLKDKISLFGLLSDDFWKSWSSATCIDLMERRITTYLRARKPLRESIVQFLLFRNSLAMYTSGQHNVLCSDYHKELLSVMLIGHEEVNMIGTCILCF